MENDTTLYYNSCFHKPGGFPKRRLRAASPRYKRKDPRYKHPQVLPKSFGLKIQREASIMIEMEFLLPCAFGSGDRLIDNFI